MTLSDDFANIADFLAAATHPEIFHYRAGLHPGAGWWLKTVCPAGDAERQDRLGLARAWTALQERYPGAILLTANAFDWLGNRLNYTWSIWLREAHDATMVLDGRTPVFALVERQDGDRYATEMLALLLRRNGVTEELLWRALQSLRDQLQQQETLRRRQSLRIIGGNNEGD